MKNGQGGDKFNVANPEDNFEEKCSVVDASGVVIAQMIFEFSRFLAGLTLGLKQIATAEAPFEPFYNRQGALIDTLRDQIFTCPSRWAFSLPACGSLCGCGGSRRPERPTPLCLAGP